MWWNLSPAAWDNLQMSKPMKYALAGAAAVVIAFLAFGVFGIQTLFFDTEADEAVPVFTSGSASGLASDNVDQSTTDDMNDEMAKEGTPTKNESSQDMPDQGDEILRLVEGSFVDRTHPGTGTAVVLSNSDQSQRFLRLEEDFATDNGPDLNVYLVAGVNVDSDAGEFDDDFIDLGDLKGNIGAQNYELAPGTDLSEYNTVVIWCVRFGVAFTVADLG
jgi:hypothetical protein